MFETLTIGLPTSRAMDVTNRDGTTAEDRAGGQDELLAYYQRRAGELWRFLGHLGPAPPEAAPAPAPALAWLACPDASVAHWSTQPLLYCSCC